MIKFENTASSLFKEMEENKASIIESIGQKKYDEELEVLKKMKEIEDKKGLF